MECPPLPVGISFVDPIPGEIGLFQRGMAIEVPLVLIVPLESAPRGVRECCIIAETRFPQGFPQWSFAAPSCARLISHG